MIRRPSILLLILVSVCSFGCDEATVHSYRAPKHVRVAAEVPAPVMAAAQNLTWVLPQGWRVFDAQGPGRVATFEAGEDELRVEVSVTVFGGDAGGVKANINRWRQQAGLDPVESASDQPMEPMQVNRHPAMLIEFPGLLVVMIDDHGRTWFIKIKSSPEVTSHHREAFVSFVQSLKWTE